MRGIDRLRAIKTRHAAATPGPWESSKHREDLDGSTPDWFSLSGEWGVYPPTAPPGEPQDGGPIALVSGDEYPGNGLFVAESWADVRDLLAVAEAARAFMSTASEFPEDPATWGESMQAIEAALEDLDAKAPKPTARRIIFLDVDGVLNDRKLLLGWSSKDSGRQGQICPKACERVNRLARAIGASVVISSSWRGDYRLWRWLGERGLRCPIVGETPSGGGCRGDEIRAWMTDNGIDDDQVVILDDDADMGDLLPRLVRTDFHGGGLLDSHVNQAIALFKEPRR